jgi:hypothetical protein
VQITATTINKTKWAGWKKWKQISSESRRNYYLLSLGVHINPPRHRFGLSLCLGLAIIGPSGVRALPLAAGINVGGHYTWHYFSSSSLFFF